MGIYLWQVDKRQKKSAIHSYFVIIISYNSLDLTIYILVFGIDSHLFFLSLFHAKVVILSSWWVISTVEVRLSK